MERVKLNSLTGCEKRDSFLKNKLKQRGMYDDLKDFVIDEHVTVKWCNLSNDKCMGDIQICKRKAKYFNKIYRKIDRLKQFTEGKTERE